MPFAELTFRLPGWMDAAIPPHAGPWTADADRMRFLISLARENIRHRTGGPFAAGVFEAETGRLVAPGVNQVTAAGCSILHAEMVAIALAQRALGTYDLSAEGLPVCELVTTTEPCAMCLGAVPWSGVARLVCGARDEDARAIGFDEGAKPADWTTQLERRGIRVTRDICRKEAAAVLREYVEGGGEIYSPVVSGQ